MRKTEFNKAQVTRYLVTAFGIAYVMQFIGAQFYNSGRITAGQLIIAASMFAPALAVILSGAGLSGMGWRPEFRKNIRTILAAWFLPAILTAIGTALYFLVFPGHFDLSGSYLVSSGAGEALKQMEAQGITYPMYVLISVIGSVTYAPLMNTFVSLGEEIGWRGFLYPQLKVKFGKRKGWIFSGIIWGIWHWPLIWLIGYEYGAAAGNPIGYFGFPVTGMVVFLVFTIALGIMHDWLYEKGGTIWLPSIFHGAVNAAATMPLAVCAVNTGTLRLLGPAPNGILAGLPFILFAVILFMKASDKGTSEE